MYIFVFTILLLNLQYEWLVLFPLSTSGPLSLADDQTSALLQCFNKFTHRENVDCPSINCELTLETKNVKIFG